MGRLDEFLTLTKAGAPPPPVGMIKEVLGRKWWPNPGPQTDCYYSLADETFYGGQAGGGKTHLLLGLAATVHQRSLLLKRIRQDAKKFIPYLAEIIGGRE